MEQALQQWKRDEGQPDFARPNECGNYRLSVTAREAECHPLEPSSTEKGGLAGFLGPWRAMPWRRQVGTVVHHLGAGAAILDPGRPVALLRHDAKFDRPVFKAKLNGGQGGKRDRPASRSTTKTIQAANGAFSSRAGASGPTSIPRSPPPQVSLSVSSDSASQRARSAAATVPTPPRAV